MNCRRFLSRFCIWPYLFLLYVGMPSTVMASNVMLEQELQTIDNLQIYKEKDANPAKFYYLPDQPRLNQHSGKPSFYIVKFNLPTTELVYVSDKEGNQKLANQGGILLVEVRFDIEEGRRKKIENELQKKHPNCTLAMLPLEKGALRISVVDVAQKKLVTFASESSPLNGSTSAFMMPLDQDGTDVMIATMKKGFAAVTFRFAFEFSGYLSPLKASVSGTWERIYNHTSWRSQTNAGFWFFRVAADIQKVYDSLVATGALKVTWTGPKDEHIQRLMDRVMEFIMKEMFEASDLKKVADSLRAPTNDQVPQAKPWWSWGFSVGTSFSYRKVEVRRKGNFFASFERWEKVPRKDVREGFLKADKFPLDWQKDHIVEVERGNWTLVKPRFFVDGLSGYSKVVVHVRYRPTYLNGAYEEKAIPFSSETGLLNGTVAWNLNKTLPKDEHIQYEYRVDAIKKDSSERYESAWKKETRQFVNLTPKDWNGPVNFTIELTYGGNLSEQNIDGVLFLVNTPGASCEKRVLRMTSQTPAVEFRCQYQLNGKTSIPAKIQMVIYKKGGKHSRKDLPLTISEANKTFQAAHILTAQDFE